MMTTTGDAMLDRLLVLDTGHADDTERIWGLLTDTVKVLFAEHAHRSDNELSFAFQYTRYYYGERGGKLIDEQLYWTVKYALAIAPLVTAMPLDNPFTPKWVGGLVEYSFVSFRVQFQPDVADYDPDMVRGAVIRKLLPFEAVDVDPAIVTAVGASWELVVKHWEKLKDGTTADAYQFVEHLRQGGSVHLTDGLL
jgi:hypothetical protein